MSLIDKGSILLIGAGASTQFDLPLGGDLLTKIAGQLQSDIRFMSKNLNSSYVRKLFYNPIYTLGSDFAQASIIYTRLRAILPDKPHNERVSLAYQELESFKKLERLLSNQTADTIDDFIAQNPSVSEQVKFAVAVQFFKALYKYDENNLNYKVRPLEGRMLNGERNWIHLFINLVRQGVRVGKVSAENPIQVVTFNYDNILEYVLDKQFTNTEMKLPPWRDVVKIHHVHGHMSNLPDETSEPHTLCQEWANAITVIHNSDIPPHIRNIRKLAVQALEKAANIYVCGFAFAGANIRLLQLNQAYAFVQNRSIHYCNYDNNIGLTRTAERLNKNNIISVKNTDNKFKVNTTTIPLSGTRDNPMTITNWFYTAVPGELPS